MKTKYVLPVLVALCVILLHITPGLAHLEINAIEKHRLFHEAPPQRGSTFVINITDEGFNPSELTIEEGDTIRWVNQTQVTVVLEEEEIYQVYLPLVARSGGRRAAEETVPPVERAITGQAISPGESYSSTLSVPGTYNYYRGDNLYNRAKITVNPKPPDLEVLAINFDVNPAPLGSEVQLSVQVHNLGLGAAKQFSVEWGLYLAGQAVPLSSGNWNVTTLLPGEYSVLTATFTAPIQPGPYILQVFGDPGSVLLDTDLSNNNLETDFGVSGRVDFCGNITTDTSWAYATYVLTCNLDIVSGASLTVTHGAVLKPNWSWVEIQVHGHLELTGDAQVPVVVTSYSDDTYGGDTNQDGAQTLPWPGHWNGISIFPGGVAHLSHALIRYGTTSLKNNEGTLTVSNSIIEYGSQNGLNSFGQNNTRVEDSTIRLNNGHGLYYSITGSFSPVIQHTTIQTNTQYAVYFNLPGETILDGTQMNGNTALNNGTNGLRLAGTFTGTSTLSGDLGFPYVLEEHPSRIGSIYITPGSTMVIQPGAIFKGWISSFWYGKGTGFEVGGTMTAVGTAGQPIIFTSAHDDAYGGDTNNNGGASLPADNRWTRIFISSGGTATFDHVKILYAGGSVAY